MAAGRRLHSARESACWAKAFVVVGGGLGVGWFFVGVPGRDGDGAASVGIAFAAEVPALFGAVVVSAFGVEVVCGGGPGRVGDDVVEVDAGLGAVGPGAGLVAGQDELA